MHLKKDMLKPTKYSGAFLTLSLFIFPVAYADDTRLWDMSLQELMNVKVSETGTLTETKWAQIPAAVTRVSQHDIQQLGARSLLELLEITVPSLQVIRHHWELPHIGLRGVTSDREDKVMIRVNGRVMNERSARGAITERDFPLMRDIKHIDVIRGAGSSMYGLGAVSIVIDITTYDATSHKENSASIRVGAASVFSAFDINLSKDFDNGLGIYFNAELADIKGANHKDAPLFFAADGTSISTGQYVAKGQPFPTRSRDGEGFSSKPFIKSHLELDFENTKFWLRYTKAGRNSATTLRYIAEPYISELDLGIEKEGLSKIGYEQLTATLDQSHKLNSTLKLDWLISFDKTDVKKIQPVDIWDKNIYGEDELFAKVLASWQVANNSNIALGFEYSYEKFGVRSIGDNLSPWHTHTNSIIGEWQWRPHQDWLVFMGGRLDNHTYSDAEFSPRFSIVYSKDQINFYKLIMTKSQRMKTAIRLHNQQSRSDTSAKPEVLNSLEARYERTTDNNLLGLSAYYIDLDTLGWDQANSRSTVVGNQTQWGFEFEYKFEIDHHRFNFSQAFTKLIDFDIAQPGTQTFITAAPYGFGNDLADWGKHTSKFWYSYQLTENTNLTTTLRAIWGFEGSRDYRDYRIALGGNSDDIISKDWKKGYKKQLYLNIGLHHQLSKFSNLTFNLHNILGVIDKDLNKRSYRDSIGSYRNEATAMSIGYTMNF
ncbi:TonB-dependent receptor plug domain-containing protein [Thalassotalea marina]|uniref:TonB-dependent receptor plug domain-containing protein n=1 Tax=Thalassotalea marina TaxID=1673741 RepID=A0A919BFN1_9GAMM|nr:TonB-dependent receptor plug domain-containing protein [Thalassotalea marina]GHF84450.1 hypothetical protein GCM10017161_09840 [Thalassotalea marina]